MKIVNVHTTTSKEGLTLDPRAIMTALLSSLSLTKLAERIGIISSSDVLDTTEIVESGCFVVARAIFRLFLGADDDELAIAGEEAFCQIPAVPSSDTARTDDSVKSI